MYFIAEEFERFCLKNRFIHVKTPPYHAKTKGTGERSVQIIKKALLRYDL